MAKKMATVGAHQLNFKKSAEEISASLKTLMERYEKEVQDIVDEKSEEVQRVGN